MELDETCCICLKRDSTILLKNINEYQDDNSEIQILEKLNQCVPDQKWYIEYKICLNCVAQLKAASEFISNCVKNEVNRKRMYDAFHRQTEFKTELEIKSDSDSNDDDLPLIHMLDDIKQESSASEDNKEIAKRKYNKKINHSTVKRKFKSENNVIESFKCDQCNMILKSKRTLLRHIQMKHREGNEKPYKCEICGVGYRCYSSYLVHKRWHNNERPFICSFCGKGFRCMKTLKSHQERHGIERAYKCDQCEKSFKTTSNLRTHKHVVHSDPENFKHICPECGKKCPSKSHLDSHLKRNHNGSKDFVCHICDKRFLFNHEVQLHIRCTHREERAYSCQLCDKSYKGLSSLKKHEKRTHNIGNFEEKPRENKYLCPYCPKVFPFNNKLQRHILSHTGEKPFKCDICLDHKGFRERYDLKAHMRNDHDIHDVV